MWMTCGVLSGVHSSLLHGGRLGGSGDKEGEACGGQVHHCSAAKVGTPALVSLPTCWLRRSQHHPCPSLPALSLGASLRAQAPPAWMRKGGQVYIYRRCEEACLAEQQCLHPIWTGGHSQRTSPSGCPIPAGDSYRGTGAWSVLGLEAASWLAKAPVSPRGSGQA